MFDKFARVVVGAGFGDEGKGLLTDYYSTPDTTVVRFSGGAQAGHTCVHGDKRHVFHHFGSGTFQGASTYLSQFFISNPIVYLRELDALQAMGVYPEVAVSGDSPVTTPYDMMINQMVEEARGIDRHGSCGLGINETIKRGEAGYPVLARDLAKPIALGDRLRDIRATWVPQRLAQLDITPTAEWQARLQSDGILATFLAQCITYSEQVAVQSMADCTGPLVFEGAQGLLLDEDHYFFPHVTHSHTGLHNVMILAREAGVRELEVTYVTRAYATRHGAGPFPRENVDLCYEDRTNVSNDWQGNLRFGHLDLDLLAESISNDLRRATLPVKHGLAVTCLDQVGEATDYWYGGRWRRSPTRDGFLQQAIACSGATFGLASAGPQSKDVITVDNFVADLRCVA